MNNPPPAPAYIGPVSRRALTLLLALPLALAACSAHPKPTTDPTPAAAWGTESHFKVWLTDFQSKVRGGAHLRLVTIDETGRVLPDAFATVTYSNDHWLIPLANSYYEEHKSDYQSPSGALDINIPQSTSVTVSVAARGRRQVRLLIDEDLLELARRDAIRPGPEPYSIAVVLRRQGGTTALQPRILSLAIFAKSGAGQAWDGVAGRRTGLIEPIWDSTKWPAQGLVFLAERNAEGGVATTQMAHKFATRKQIPLKLRIVCTDPGGGLLLVASRWGLEDLCMAPEAGYVHEVNLSLQQILEFHEGGEVSEGLFFYVKMNGKYGKMQLRHIDYDDPSVGVRLSATVRFQPNGSRNLEEN